MRALIQRVKQASVQVDAETVGAIGEGLLIFIGITLNDGEAEVAWMAKKLAKLRIFPDAAGLMNLSLQDIGGEALVVSQFTLYADCLQGNRPSFTAAARPEKAEPLYLDVVAALQEQLNRPIATGRFGADMRVSLINSGPVTLWLESPKKLG